MYPYSEWLLETAFTYTSHLQSERLIWGRRSYCMPASSHQNVFILLNYITYFWSACSVNCTVHVDQLAVAIFLVGHDNFSEPTDTCWSVPGSLRFPPLLVTVWKIACIPWQAYLRYRILIIKPLEVPYLFAKVPLLFKIFSSRWPIACQTWWHFIQYLQSYNSRKRLNKGCNFLIYFLVRYHIHSTRFY